MTEYEERQAERLAAQTVRRLRAVKGKLTPSEFMTLWWARKDSGEELSGGQRGFLIAATRPGSGEVV